MEKDPILTFDTLFSFPHIQIMKIALPFLPCEYLHTMAIYIKFAELLYTIKMKDVSFGSFYSDFHKEKKEDDYEDIISLFDSISPYISGAEKDQFSRIKNLLNSMKQIKEMQPLLDMMIAMQGNSGGMNNESILKQFLNEDQMAMFQFFMNQNEEENNSEGGFDHGTSGMDE